MGTFIHPTASVDPDAVIGEDVAIWNWTAVREGASIGERTKIGQCAYIDHDVRIGARCKIQNGVSVYFGVTLEDDVFVGPNATFTNDRRPRAASETWEVVPTVVAEGASIGANATIVCGVRLGAHCMVGAGAVVTRDVPAHGLVLGQPARLVDYVDLHGERIHHDPAAGPPPVERLGVG